MEAKILTGGNAFKRKDGRWGGVVWYMTEDGERKRKSFAARTKTEVCKKMKNFILDFGQVVEELTETKETVETCLMRWLQVFKYPSVERPTYDRYDCSARYQILPYIGKHKVKNITATDLRKLFNTLMQDGYAYTTVKKAYSLLKEFFSYMTIEGQISKNPMQYVPMIKKANFYSAQGKELKPTCETVDIFTPEEIEQLRRTAAKRDSKGRMLFKQPEVFFLMLNTGMRTGEALGLRHSDIDLENRVLHVRRAVKSCENRDENMNVVKYGRGRGLIVGKPKSATSVRDIPLNDAAIAAIKAIREQVYYGEDSPLIPDANGDHFHPDRLRCRYYRLLDAAGVRRRGMHCLRHTFATNLVNGVPQPDGTLKTLSVKQVANLLGHSTTEVTEMYYVRREDQKLAGLTDDFVL